MPYGFKVEVWGDYALFSRPEMKAERVTYDVITPSAARGLLESVYWHPGLQWYIDRIYVLNKIKFANIRRNEGKSKASARNMKTAMDKKTAPPYMAMSKEIQQRASLLLKDVHYVIEAHFELTDKANSSDNKGKFCDIFRRRLQKGQAYSQPYFGCRECTAHFREYRAEDITTAYKGEKDLGFMLYDLDYSDPNDIKSLFFRAILKDGVLEVNSSEVHQ